MDMNNEAALTQALERAEVASTAAQRAVDARDAKQAPGLIYETLVHTLEALALAARAGQLGVLQNLTPNAVFYVKVLTALNVDPFDAVRGIGIGSSIGVTPERTDEQRVADFFAKIANGVDGLSHLANLLGRGEL